MQKKHSNLQNFGWEFLSNEERARLQTYHEQNENVIPSNQGPWLNHEEGDFSQNYYGDETQNYNGNCL